MPDEESPHANLHHPRRIVVAGAGGAGKTTLCRDISRRLGLPYTELDALQFGPDWRERPSFLADVAELVSHDSWVTEWDHEGARELLCSRAELFIWIDLPQWRTVSRAIARSRQLRRTGEAFWSGNTEPPLYTILTDPDHSVRWSIRDYSEARALADAAIRNHPEIAAVHLHSPREVEEFRATMDRILV